MSRQVRWRTILGWFALLIAAAAVVVAGIYVVFWPVSDLIARHDVGAITGPQRAAALQAARDAARGRLLTFGAGLFAAAALVYTARNFTLSRHTFELTEQGQVTERYTKAIEQLGSDKLDVRIGAVYALERIARDSATDHPTVMEVLAAFIREHSREQWPLPEREPGAPSDRVQQKTTRPDVQAAVTVIGRRQSGNDRRAIDLTSADLSGADLGHADLSGARLTEAVLSLADLSGTNLIGAYLVYANLGFARLSGANLGGAYLGGADLTCAILTGADLTGAQLTGARLTRADFSDADLSGANLSGADLTGTNLTGADLTGTLYPPVESVPEGWVRDPDSGRLRRHDPATQEDAP